MSIVSGVMVMGWTIAVVAVSYFMGYAKGRMDEYDKQSTKDRRMRMGLTKL